MKTEPNSLSLPQINLSRFNESDEGGLDLGQIIATLRRRILLVIGITLGVAALGIVKALTDTPVYQGQFEILTEPVTLEKKIISSTNPDNLSSQEDTITDEVKLKILKSPGVMAPIVKKLQTRYPELTYSTIIENLNITTIGKDAEVLAVSYQHQQSEIVKYVLDVVAKDYLDYSLHTRQTGIGRGIDFVERQLPQLRSRVETQQKQLQIIRQQNNLVDPELKGQQLSNLISAFEQQQLETQIKLNEAKVVYTYLQKELAQGGSEAVASSALVGNSRYQELLKQLLEVDSQIAKESPLLLEKSPEILILKQQRQNLVPLIRQEGQKVAKQTLSLIQELETRYQVLTQTLERLNRQVKQLAVILYHYNNTQKEVQITTDNLNQFLSKREALRIEAAQREIPWQLLTPQGEPKPVSVSLKQNLALGTILGLLLGLAVALSLEKASDRIYTSKEIKEITRLLILGVIPLEPELKDYNLAEKASILTQLTQWVRDHKLTNNGYHKSTEYLSSSFFEAFRFLYTNIRLLINPESAINSLVISSAAPGDGKSTVAVYLAQAAAAMGQRVLLVDTDLHYPSLHEHLQVLNKQGLVNILSAEALDLNHAIQKSPLEDNLFVLTAGQTPPDPTRFLASQKMRNLMEKLPASFDLVIYKAPSLLEFPDAYLLAPYTSGMLLVASLGKLKRSVLEQALDDLKTSNTSVLGVVVNKAK